MLHWLHVLHARPVHVVIFIFVEHLDVLKLAETILFDDEVNV